jgi:MFS family permease
LKPDFPAPSRQAYFALGVLLLAYILSFIDRNVMAVLIGPIRAEFDISDFQYSLLHGFAFSMFYIVLGLPIARLADRANRKWIITIGVAVWSLMTCLCGVARTFGALFMTRMGVGVGEAALSPPAFSLLSDLFPAEKLARAISVYSLGITIGGGLAYIVGGAIYAYFATLGGMRLPLLGQVSAWQMTFVAVGLPGFIVVGLLACLKEPVRHGGVSMPDASLAEVKNQLRQHWQAYLGAIGSVSLLGILGYGTMAWYPEFLIRTFGMDRADAGTQFGLIFLVVGSLGTLTGGWSVLPLSRRGYRDAPMRVILATALLWVLPASLGPLAGTQFWAIVAACPIVFFLNAYYGVAVAAVQLITPNRMRAQVSALMLFMTNLFGLALGPAAVAVLTDYVFGDDQALRYSLALVPLLVCPAAALLVVLGLKPYRRALEAV